MALPPSNTTLTCSTTGEQKTAVLILQFPNNTPAYPGVYGTADWWKQAITGSGSSVNRLWAEMTAGKTFASVDVYGPLTLAQSYTCADYYQLRSAALTLASQTIDLSKYTRIVLGFPQTACTYGGLADVGCNGADAFVPHPYSVVWMPILTYYAPTLGVWGSLAHELGHNLGLNHANTLDFGSMALGPIDFQSTNPGTVGNTGATTAQGAITAIDREYGDSFSVMGSPWVAGPGPYSAEHRARLLGWVPAGTGLATATAAGSYTLQPASTGTATRALRVLRDSASASWLWLEYRNGSAPFDAANLQSVAGQNLAAGAVLHYENGYGDHDKTYLLDMAPVAKGNNFANSALVAGTTWSDPYSPLSLTANSVNGSGLTVSVRYDTVCASFSTATDPIDAAGGSSRVTVTAPSGCAWTAGTNAPWLTLGGVISGTGNGSFTWTAAANTGAGQRVTYLSVGRSSQRLLQVGSGANVVGLFPLNATATPGAPIMLSVALQDTAGVADLQQLTFTAYAPGSAPCLVAVTFRAGSAAFFLYDTVSNTFGSAVAAGSASSTTNSSCTLTGKGSGITASGSTFAVTMNLTFLAAVPGVRGLFATIDNGTELPVGILNVGTDASVTTPPVTLKPTVTVLSSSATTALPGTTLAFAVAVTGTGGTPTGSVALLDGATTLATLPLDANGRASFATTALGNGAHALTAVYSGDSSFAASTSASATVTVAKAASVATLTASASSVSAGGGASLNLVVAAAAGSVASGMSAPSGTATLSDGATAISTVTFAGGKAVFPLSAIGAGTHSYTVDYSGDTLYLASTSNAVSVVAGKPTASLTLSAPALALAGQTASVTVAAAAGAGGTTPTGSVLLQDGGQTVGTAPLGSSGTATFSVGPLAAGIHLLTITYTGDAAFGPAGATTATVRVADYALSGPASQLGGAADITVQAGATSGNAATFALTPGAGGFPVAVAFTCSGAPAQSTCTVSPNAVTPGSAATPVIVTVTTTASTVKKAGLAGWLSLPLLALLAHPRTRRHSLRLCMLALCFAAVSGLSGCGSGVATGTTPPEVVQNQGTPAGRTVLTIQGVATANGGSLARSVTLTLQVN